VSGESLEKVRQPEWSRQWDLLHTEADQPPELFLEWIAPNTLERFRGARVLDAGCGGGHQATLVATVAREITAMDLNVSRACRDRLAAVRNARVYDGNLVTVTSAELGGPFDIVYSIGVLHHTYDPDRAFANLLQLVRPGGRIIIWVYSWEGNGVARHLVEPVRKTVLRWLPRKALWWMSWGITVPALALMHTVYRLPLRGALPMYDYLERSRRLTPRKIAGNVFDKLNAPHTDFIRRERIESWFADPRLTDVHLSPHLGVSWRGSATRREPS
jgi:2-polyprenyl-3-methyl-5-hydroxy-6-metoxy-1,4-benzoquinol methylase